MKKFEQDKVTAMIRILKNRPRVPTLLELNYIERYLLEEYFGRTRYVYVFGSDTVHYTERKKYFKSNYS